VLLGWNAPAAVVEQALAAREQWGVASFKMKAGIDLEADIATARALREALGDGALIYADANHAFTPDQALRFLDATADCALAWFEEPCPSAERIGRQRVVAYSRIPIVGDESCADLPTATAEVLEGRSTMVSIKVARTAILASARIRAMCEATGVEVVVGSQGDSGIGTLVGAALVAASPFTGRHPAELMYFLDLQEDLLAEPPTITGGRLNLSPAPGFGIVIDEEKLRRFAVGETIRCA
jgi:L-alanine-DL-glutamate epimerase-like enolase superfamily enzyme